MSQLGEMGRFGNQLVQYAFLKTYARTHDLEMQVPPWIGNQLFGCSDPPIRKHLPSFRDPCLDEPHRVGIPFMEEPLCNTDVLGYFQYHTAYYAPHRDYIRSLFRPLPAVAKQLQPAVERLRGKGRTVVALHIRRGDYGYRYFYLTPTSWYLEWLAARWATFAEPVLLIVSDDLDAVVPDFASYKPVIVRDLHVSLPQAPYFVDFYLLTQADVLAIPNSTFSFVAAMLNERLRLAVRSLLSDPLEHPPFRAFDPWNAEFLDRSAHVANYPNIPGISRPADPAPPRGAARWKVWLKSKLLRRAC
ncbi:hypothetical protein AYO44_12510 [Planctomycetaceae bacterium SCGC AG-212-F19]|nr:hypothetical protein AYO44_12510 [Planctomycetaceae bacterium SCGC AG-212-F19]